MLKEWLGAIKVAGDIVKGGISAYEAGEEVDALIAKASEEYQEALTEEYVCFRLMIRTFL